MERRGFLQFGPNIPEVVLDRPSAITEVHEEFALAGSDVIEAFTVCCSRFLSKRNKSYELAHCLFRTTSAVRPPK